MKKQVIFGIALALAILSCLPMQGQEKVVPLKYGNMDHWVIRNIKESAIIGGNQKTIYAVGPNMTIHGNTPYTNKGGSPWGSSNVLAHVSGIYKTNNSVYRDRHGSGYCAKLETHIEKVKVLGLINIKVLAAGSLFLGDVREPITSTKDGPKAINWGIPFTARPKALRFDYKTSLPNVRPTSKQIPVVEVKGKTSAKIDLIAIGASTGGTEALAKVLKELVPPLPPIVIVQHIPPMFSKLFADRLHNECHISVKEAQNGDKLEPNWAYVAPGDKQMKVKNFGGNMQLDVNHGPKVNGHCPSVDVLFDSVADQIGNNALGVILTGMGADGANGLLKMRQQGAATIGQDEASCVVYGMPRAAYEKGAVERQLPLSGIASMITTVAHGQGRR